MTSANIRAASRRSKRLTLAKLNKRNRQFWQEQSRLMEERMSDESVRDLALQDVKSEMRRVPLKHQVSLESALERAHNAKLHFQRNFSKKGGIASKADALQKLILAIVRKNRQTTEQELIGKLKVKGSTIGLEIDEEAVRIRWIYFTSNGKAKRARMSGLKDRLSRAKKIVNRKRKPHSR